MSMIRHYFPGGNTPIGFVSFYGNILNKDSVGKLAVIKGGPGTGKSSIMKKIGEYFKNENEDVDYLHCSSDVDSLDGVYLPKYNSAVIDGTAPHIVDPRYPGAYDKIFNVGDFIDSNIEKHREDIFLLNRNISNCFSKCYENLRIASSVYDAMKSESLKNADFRAIDDFCYNISRRVIHNRDSKKTRKMFLSGITPQGNVNFCDSIMHDKYIIRLDCEVGDVAGEVMKKILSYCENQNTDINVYYCPLKPYEPEQIVFENTQIAITTSNVFHTVAQADEIVSFKEFSKNDYDNSENEEIYKKYVNKALNDVGKAKKYHDELESFYINNFDFSKTEGVFEKIKDFLVS